MDRNRKQIEIDIVARRTDGGMLTGSVKWSGKPFGISLHRKHMEMLKSLSESGHGWAHEAFNPDSILYYVSAAGFEPDFTKRAEEDGQKVITFSLDDLYR